MFSLEPLRERDLVSLFPILTRAVGGMPSLRKPAISAHDSGRTNEPSLSTIVRLVRDGCETAYRSDGISRELLTPTVNCPDTAFRRAGVPAIGQDRANAAGSVKRAIGAGSCAIGNCEPLHRSGSPSLVHFPHARCAARRNLTHRLYWIVAFLTCFQEAGNRNPLRSHL